eukprot:6066039-Amphidinium_carterae.1
MFMMFMVWGNLNLTEFPCVNMEFPQNHEHHENFPCLKYIFDKIAMNIMNIYPEGNISDKASGF